MIAGILTLALVLVGLRFWVENLAAPAQGLGAVAVDHRNAPAVIVNDELILHERSGLDIDRLPLRDFGAGHNAAIAFFSNGDLLLWQPPVENPLPAWVSRFMTADTEAPGTLSRCSLDTRDCTLIRDGVESARFIVEPRTDNILLADQGKNRLEKLTPSGERLAVRSMDLTPPVSLALKEGILYLTRGHLNNVSVLKPDTIDFAARLETIDLRLDDLGQSGLIFPTAIAPLGGHWWAVLQSRDATTAGLFRFGPDWQARERVDLPAGAQPAQLAVWAHKLLAPDPRSEVVYRVADDGTVEKLFNEDTLSAALAERRGEIAKTRTMQSLVLLVLSLGAIGLLALGSLRSLQRKVYQPATDASAARFDINDDAIQWLAPAAARDARLRFLGVGMGVLSAALLIGAFIAQLSAPVLLAICLLLVGLGGFYAALQRASACYLGRLGDQLILVDHDNTYRVGHGANIQYLDNFVMIDDVVVFLGNRLLPRFAGEQLKQQFAPLVTRGIKVDRTTLRLKLMSSRHPLLYGVTGFAVCGVFALALLVLA